jgi:hypothetical protein
VLVAAAAVDAAAGRAVRAFWPSLLECRLTSIALGLITIAAAAAAAAAVGQLISYYCNMLPAADRPLITSRVSAAAADEQPGLQSRRERVAAGCHLSEGERSKESWLCGLLHGGWRRSRWGGVPMELPSVSQRHSLLALLHNMMQHDETTQHECDVTDSTHLN